MWEISRQDPRWKGKVWECSLYWYMRCVRLWLMINTLRMMVENMRWQFEKKIQEIVIAVNVYHIVILFLSNMVQNISLQQIKPKTTVCVLQSLFDCWFLLKKERCDKHEKFHIEVESWKDFCGLMTHNESQSKGHISQVSAAILSYRGLVWPGTVILQNPLPSECISRGTELHWSNVLY